ncbi:PREDICTED: probable transcription factor At1g61730 [Camelina sativa]|uniref:Probable transcription factor At1g61730 n=1 Tax=Camelina sativa TaxID=90675 RepID=A0ABM1RBW7_CAMSA|nr:PREDICTED: probable transcription factor At1g61730 [Camelina sativa]
MKPPQKASSSASNKSVSESESEESKNAESTSRIQELLPLVTASSLPMADSALPASSKKRQRGANEESGTSKRGKVVGTQFHKKWSEEDEVILVQTMIDHCSKLNDKHAFYKIVSNSMSFEIKSMKQLSGKIRWLKNKYVGR